MARQIASGLSDTGSAETITGRESAVLYVEFTVTGDFDLEHSPDDGTTWLVSDNYTSDGVYHVRIPSGNVRVNVNSGTVNVWIGD